MKKLKHMVCAVVAAVLVATALSACAPEEDNVPVDIALVVAPVMGATAPDRDAIDDALTELAQVGDSYAVIVADGDPHVVLDAEIDTLPDYEPDAARVLTSIRDEVAQFAATQVPTHPQVNLSAAISVAARTFTPGHRHVLVVFSSGIQSVGTLSMLDGRLYSDPADLIRYAQEQKEIPELGGVSVRMPQLGVVTAPQESPTEDAIQQLQSIWRLYFETAKAESIDFTPGSLTPHGLSGDLPDVTPVPILRPAPAPAEGCVQRLEDQSIGFESGSASLADASSVRATLTTAVESLASCEGKYRIDSSASSEGETDANMTLSANRGATIRDLMEDITGLPSADFEMHPWGEGWPCRIPDVDAAGNLILEAASTNRVVVISKGTQPC